MRVHIPRPQLYRAGPDQPGLCQIPRFKCIQALAMLRLGLRGLLRCGFR